jgi:hypothetical protein
MPNFKQKRIRDRAHLNFIKTLPCCMCGAPQSDPAHIRLGTDGGTGLKPSDNYVLPLCRPCHQEEHRGSRTFWAKAKRDPLGLANALYILTGQETACIEQIVRFRR